MKKERWLTIAVILLLVIGVSVLLYPTISSYFSAVGQKKAITNYRSLVEDLQADLYERVLEDAQEYNRRHTYNNFSLSDAEAATDEYLTKLSVGGMSVMGYLEIEKINVKLPIYHSVSESILKTGIGHMAQTSLPVGGESSHSVLTGHTGLATSTLLTDLDQIEIGDTIKIHILNEVFAYEVDQILVVLPEETESLAIEEGQDYITLVTCTPYGVNSHRLLVRGHAVEYLIEDTEEEIERIPDSSYQTVWILTGCCIAVVLVIIVAFVAIKIKKTKR